MAESATSQRCLSSDVTIQLARRILEWHWTKVIWMNGTKRIFLSTQCLRDIEKSLVRSICNREHKSCGCVSITAQISPWNLTSATDSVMETAIMSFIPQKENMNWVFWALYQQVWLKLVEMAVVCLEVLVANWNCSWSFQSSMFIH